jgi:hypothetical protein
MKQTRFELFPELFPDFNLWLKVHVIVLDEGCFLKSSKSFRVILIVFVDFIIILNESMLLAEKLGTSSLLKPLANY